MTQAQIKKVVAVPAVKAVKAPAKKTTVRKAVAKKAAPVALPTVKYSIVDFARPKAGNTLFAFTSAWLELTGLSNGGAMARTRLVQIAGETAITYHTKNGNLAKTESGLTLSDKGQMFFATRTEIDPQVKAAFVDVLANGTVNDLVIRNAKAIVAL